jgi:hypothetical protein
MSCDIANGRLEQCKDSVSGLDAIFFINYGDYNAETDVTYNVTNTDQIDDINGVSNLYKYELKGANSFEQAINSSRENGTTFVEQTLTIQLKKQDAATHKTVKLLAYGRPHIVVKTRSNQYFLMGLERGADLTAGTISSGVQLGDMNGYSLTFTAQENIPANFLNCSTDAGLATLFSSATIVTS